MIVSLIRHGKTSANIEGRYQGQTDTELCETGILEISAYRDAGLYPPMGERLYTSPLKRCLQTAALIYPDYAPVIADNLKELGFGDFEGRTYEEVGWPFGKEDDISFPNGESLREFDRRVRQAFTEILAEGAYENIVIVCHGGVIMSLMRFLFGGTLGEWRVENGSGYRLTLCRETKTGEILGRIAP